MANRDFDANFFFAAKCIVNSDTVISRCQPGYLIGRVAIPPFVAVGLDAAFHMEYDGAVGSGFNRCCRYLPGNASP